MNGNINFKHQIIFAIITPIAMILTGLLTYVFVDRFSMEEKKVQISLDIMQLISDIQPNISIKLQERIGSERNQLVLNFDFYNEGPYPVIVNDFPKLKLFIPTTKNMVTEDRELVEGKEYEVIQPRIKLLAPKKKITHTIGVTLKGEKGDFPGNRLFYGLSTKFDTDSKITKLSKILLYDYLSEEDISDLAKNSSYTYGLLLP